MINTDRFFIKDGSIFALSPLQIEQGLSQGLRELTEEEKQAILNPPKEIVVPEFVTRAQGKAALIRAGLWQGVLSYVASIEDETEKSVAEVALNDTTNWQRSSPFLNDAAHALGLTDEQLDGLFLQASKIEL